MDAELKKQLSKIANTIRELSMEAVQKANSGHPGLPMGCAEFGAYLYGVFAAQSKKSQMAQPRPLCPLSRSWFDAPLFLSASCRL